jgi:hypothetical protein
MIVCLVISMKRGNLENALSETLTSIRRPDKKDFGSLHFSYLIAFFHLASPLMMRLPILGQSG